MKMSRNKVHLRIRFICMKEQNEMRKMGLVFALFCTVSSSRLSNVIFIILTLVYGEKHSQCCIILTALNFIYFYQTAKLLSCQSWSAGLKSTVTLRVDIVTQNNVGFKACLPQRPTHRMHILHFPQRRSSLQLLMHWLKFLVHLLHHHLKSAR